MAEKHRLHVEFFTKAKPDPRASKEQGRPIFRDVEMVCIKFPGDNKRELVAPANQKSLRNPENGEYLTYIERFPEHYAAFKKGEEQAQTGTPIEELPFLTNSKRAELKGMSIVTAEMLADLDDRTIRKLGMGARDLADQAKAYLNRAESTASTAAMQGEIEALKAQIAALAGEKAEPAKAPVDSDEGEFADIDDAALKEIIKDATGAAPKGNPSRATLIRLVREAAAAKDKAA